MLKLINDNLLVTLIIAITIICVELIKQRSKIVQVEILSIVVIFGEIKNILSKKLNNEVLDENETDIIDVIKKMLGIKK